MTRRSVGVTATPKPRCSFPSSSVSVLSVRPDSQKMTTFGWNPTVIGTVVPAAPVPMLNAPSCAWADADMSSRVSQSPDGIVLPVVSSAYQQPDCPVVRLMVCTGPGPCVRLATLLEVPVHAVSVAWFVFRKYSVAVAVAS